MWGTLNNKEIWQGEICNRAKDVSLYWLEGTILPFVTEKNQLFQYLSIRFDITNRKNAEHVMRQQANREKLLRAITDGISQSLNLQTIFDTACEENRKVIDADRVAIFKFDQDLRCNQGEFAAESLAIDFPSVLNVKVCDPCLVKITALHKCGIN